MSSIVLAGAVHATFRLEARERGTTDDWLVVDRGPYDLEAAQVAARRYDRTHPSMVAIVVSTRVPHQYRKTAPRKLTPRQRREPEGVRA